MVLDDGCGATIELSCKRPILPKPTNYATLDKPKSPSVENNSQDEIVLSQDQDPAYAGLTDTGRTINLKGYDVGAVVKVKGGLRIFGGEQQVRLERICTLLMGGTTVLILINPLPHFNTHIHSLRIPFGLNPKSADHHLLST